MLRQPPARGERSGAAPAASPAPLCPCCAPGAAERGAIVPGLPLTPPFPSEKPLSRKRGSSQPRPEPPPSTLLLSLLSSSPCCPLLCAQHPHSLLLQLGKRPCRVKDRGKKWEQLGQLQPKPSVGCKMLVSPWSMKNPSCGSAEPFVTHLSHRNPSAMFIKR